jgi:DNA-directed RNA polymerase specialized sigma24 family protein
MEIDSRQVRRKLHVMQEGFDLLLAQLDSDRNLAGQKYESLRRKLIKFFQWWGSQDADELADEAFDRVARKLAQGEPIRDPAAYLIGVARLIFKEHVKSQIKLRAAVEQIPKNPVTDKDLAIAEAREECYANCLGKLPAESRDLVVRYYQSQDGDKASNRDSLSVQMNIPINLLRVRAFRIRKKLADCLDDCVNNRTEGL